MDLIRRRAAVDLVQALFERHRLKEDVLAALRSDRSTDPAIRAAAIEIAERRGEDAQGLYESAWLTVLRPAGTPELYLRSLRELEAACRIVTADPPRLGQYQHALGLALYRVGRFDDALRQVDRLNAPSAGERLCRRGRSTWPSAALASQKLGRFAEARASLEQLRKLVGTEGDSSDQEAIGFLEEAESVVHE